MKISVVTPTHDTQWMREAWQSLLAQTHADFEWLVFVNDKTGGRTRVQARANEVAAMTGGDPRVRVVLDYSVFEGVGSRKKTAFADASGEILLELDHDDMLTANALAEVAKAFEDPEIGFVYSDYADFDGAEPFGDELVQGSITYRHPDVRQSWINNGFQFYDRQILGSPRPGFYECVRAFPPIALAMSLIFWAPNHLRAWRADVYRAVGGHNPEYKLCDDHELVIRTYLISKFHHIPLPLYLYRVSGDNTWAKNIDEIDRLTRALQSQYLERLVLREAVLSGLPAYDLGSAIVGREGWRTVDIERNPEGPKIDVVADLRERWPWEDGSVAAFRASDFLEHLPNKAHTMSEIWRCLKPGGWLLSCTPSTDGRGAFQDPTHCCHSEDTEVFTTDGFKLFTELTGEEKIYTYDAENKIAVEQPCSKVHVYDHDGEMIHFTGRSVDCLVTPDHRMFVGSSDAVTPFKFRRAEDLVGQKNKRMPSSVTFDGDYPDYFEIPGSRLVLQSNPNERFVGDTVRLPIRPFMEFMGWFISEGWTTIKNTQEDGGRYNFYGIGISQSESANPEKFELIGQCIERLGYKPNRTKKGWVFSDKHFATWLSRMGTALVKYIPVEIKQMAPELLRLMLDSACLGDGTLNGKTSRTYASSSKRLASDIQEVAIKCGFKTTMSKEDRTGKTIAINPDYRANSDMHLVYISRPKECYLTTASRVSYKGKVACVTVPKHNVILTRRNGRVIWSGNSYWNQNSFWYYTRREQARYIRNKTIRFQEVHLYTNFPSKWYEDNQISYVYANLVALKLGYEGPGEKGI
jgi:O-antigen biosynthesis protein